MASTSATSEAFAPAFSPADAAQPGSVTAQPQSPASFSLMPTPQAEDHPSIHGLTGRSPAMRRLIQQMQRMAPHLTMATLEGEEGTGRTLAAAALHAAGPVPEAPFVPCLATQFFTANANPDTEKHEPPSETRSQPTPRAWSESILRQAHAGMLFLDSVHQLSTAQQQSLAEFLHWFDDRNFRARRHSANPYSAEKNDGIERNLPAQLVFSTSVPLRNSGFREDLASRLCSVRFHLPPLSQRREDIPLLAQIFVQRFARLYGKPVRGLGPGTIAPLLRYPWPGNVRELEEKITAAALETESQWIRPIDLPPLAPGPRHNPSNGLAGTPDDSDFNLDRAIRNHVTRVLTRTRGNKLRAAQLLGISRSTLYRILAAEPSAGQPPEASSQLL